MRLLALHAIAATANAHSWAARIDARGPGVRSCGRRDGVKGKRGEMHGLLTREVEADEGEDLLCDLGPVRRVFPEELGEQRL